MGITEQDFNAERARVNNLTYLASYPFYCSEVASSLLLVLIPSYCR
jgi:hypothetical protein